MINCYDVENSNIFIDLNYTTSTVKVLCFLLGIATYKWFCRKNF